MDKYELMLKEKGIRPNKNRVAVLSKLAEEGKAFSLCTMSKELFAQMDRTTVYRTLTLLTEKQLINKIPCSDGNTLYSLQNKKSDEVNTTQFRCKSCQKVESLPTLPQEYLKTISDKMINLDMVVLEGYCCTCR
ncbi:MAG: hypothetical protein EA341_15805 [Mongoliibacter sp.]|uniref:Fur family transcriptional regulator n=1 Tax=Mongoliibacter sp. TaxID=2022438 RepID=UPI0012F008E8|nr:transcriptional repressor [Mongoliibacter sp.]TVP44967.1 MAG: hypothetical protein EA341_15805 [Mongoliibacter sp.]